jgi:Polysaccharide pyruvyl transferase
LDFCALTYPPTNLGDEIQTLAAMQYLPDFVPLVSRESLNVQPPLLRRKIILNGWFMHKPESWPPAKSLEPLLVSMHITPKAGRMITGAGLEYFRAHAARQKVGARDLQTLRDLNENGVDAYFSGCLTLTMQPYQNIERSDTICAVDLNHEEFTHLAARTKRPIMRVTHSPTTIDPWARLQQADEFLKSYQSAAAVVTSRLHAALPTAALGTPVLMILRSPQDPRFDGLVEHVHPVARDDFLTDQFSFSFDDPPSNPRGDTERVRALAAACEAFTGIKPSRRELSLTTLRTTSQA